MNWKPAALFAASMLTALAAASACRAGCGVRAVCAAPVVHHKAAVVQQVVEPVYAAPVVAPVVAYYGGLGVREEAIAERYAQKMVEAFQQFQATQTTTTTKTTFQSQAPPPQPYTAPQQQACPSCSAAQQGYPPPEPQQPAFNFTAPAETSQLQTSCANCHSGPSAKSGFDIQNATPEQWRNAAARVMDDSMPPKATLSPDQKQAVQFEAFQQWQAAVAAEFGQ